MSWKEVAVRSLSEVINSMEVTLFQAAEHPWYSAIGAVVGSVVALRIYSRYTVGVCHCTTDLTGKTVVITGGNAGIGKETAAELARQNATVILGCRNSARGRRAVNEIIQATGNDQVTFLPLDLCSFNSVRRFAESLKRNGSLHILINNAGVTGSGGRVMTEDGCEHIMQANYLGHFLLTLLLIDLLKATGSSRIINVSSLVYRWAKLDLTDLDSRRSYNPTEIYNNSKLAQILFTKELAKKLEGTGVTVNAINPGVVATNIVRNTPFLESIATKILFGVIGKTPLEGAQTVVHVAMSSALQNVSGQYFSDCKIEKLEKIAENQRLAKRLFLKSEEIVGLKWDTVMSSSAGN